MNKPPDKLHDPYQCVKVPLTHIITDPQLILKLNETVINANKIVIYSLQFIKLYSLHHFKLHQMLPEITLSWINNVMKTICKAPTTGRKPSNKTMILKDEL